MTEPITITLKVPSKELHAHNHAHWRAKAAAVKRARGDGKIMALKALAGRVPPRWNRVKMDYVFYFYQKNNQDLMNAAQSCKAGIDGIVDAGIVTDDNHTVVRPVTLDAGEYDPANPRVVITITPLEPGAETETP